MVSTPRLCAPRPEHCTPTRLATRFAGLPAPITLTSGQLLPLLSRGHPVPAFLPPLVAVYQRRTLLLNDSVSTPVTGGKVVSTLKLVMSSRSCGFAPVHPRTPVLVTTSTSSPRNVSVAPQPAGLVVSTAVPNAPWAGSMRATVLLPETTW